MGPADVQTIQFTLDTTALSGAIGALSGLLVGLSVAWTRVVRPIQQIAKDWRGEAARPEDGVPERPSMMKRMATQELVSGKIWAEMHPNGGSSMKDQLSRVDANLGAHIASHSVVLVAPGNGSASVPSPDGMGAIP